MLTEGCPTSFSTSIAWLPVVCAALSSEVDVRDMSAEVTDRDLKDPLMLRPKKPINWSISS